MDFDDPRWFPVDLHVPDRRYGFGRVDDEALDRFAFLDTRAELSIETAQPVDAASIAPGMPQARVGWLFHTSFCGSTLLSRALHMAPHAICLREPLVLRRLGDARHAGWPVDGLLEQAVRLLARPWHAGGAVLIKPTHAALNVAADLMAVIPDSRAIVLTSSLDDFLVSNLKKSSETQRKIPALAERGLGAGRWAARLPRSALNPPDLLCAAALQWSAQRELCQDIADAMGNGRMRSIDMAWLLEDFDAAVQRIAEWLGLGLPHDRLHRQCAQILEQNAKVPDVSYGPQKRATESALVRSLHQAPLAHANRWWRQHVYPAMRPEAAADPPPLPAPPEHSGACGQPNC